jgi:hypothetical protein
MEEFSSAQACKDRLPKEGHAAFGAFCSYRNMGTEERSLRAVAKALDKNKSLIERWSVRHGWMERTLQWDLINEREDVQSKNVDAQKLHKRHLEELNTAAVPRLKLAMALAGRGAEVSEYLRKLPIRKLFNLTLRASRGLMAIHKAQRSLVTYVLSIDSAASDVGGSNEESEPALVILPFCRCKQDHDCGFPKWPCESAKAYAAFRIYRELGPKRSIRATASNSGHHASQIGRWASKHFWKHRAALYDKHIRNQIEPDDFTKEKQLLRRQFNELKLAERLSMQVIETFDRRKEELNVDILELLRMAIKAARLLPLVHKGERDALFFDEEIERKGEQIFVSLRSKTRSSELLSEILSEEPMAKPEPAESRSA